MELFLTINDGFLLDYPLEILNKFWSFGVFFPRWDSLVKNSNRAMRKNSGGFLIKMSKERRIQNPVKHLRWNFWQK